MTLDELLESTRQRVSRFIIPDHERDRTWSSYRGVNGMDIMDKHLSLKKALKSLKEKLLEERDSSDDDESHRRKRPRSSSGDSKSQDSGSFTSSTPFFL